MWPSNKDIGGVGCYTLSELVFTKVYNSLNSMPVDDSTVRDHVHNDAQLDDSFCIARSINLWL